MVSDVIIEVVSSGHISEGSGVGSDVIVEGVSDVIAARIMTS